MDIGFEWERVVVGLGRGNTLAVHCHECGADLGAGSLVVVSEDQMELARLLKLRDNLTVEIERLGRRVKEREHTQRSLDAMARGVD